MQVRICRGSFWLFLGLCCLAATAEAADYARELSEDEPQTVAMRPGDSLRITLAEAADHPRILIIERRAIETALRTGDATSDPFFHPVISYSSEYLYVSAGEAPSIHATAGNIASPAGKLVLKIVAIESNETVYRSVVKLLNEAARSNARGTQTDLTHALPLYIRAAVALGGGKSDLARRIRAEALHGAGELAFALEDVDSTTRFLKSAADEFADLKEPALQAVALSSLIQWHYNNDDLVSAYSLLAPASSAAKASGDPIVENRVELNRCLLLLEEFQLDAAETCLTERVALAGASGDRLIQVAANGALAGVYSNRGQHSRALPPLRDALENEERYGSDRSIGLAHNNLAIQYRRLGDTQTALNHYHAALDNFEKASVRSLQRTTLRNIGRAYYLLGDSERAARFYERSLSLSEQTGNRRLSAMNLLQLALTDQAMNREEMAMLRLEQAEIIAEEISDNKLVFDVLLTRARIFLENRRLGDALAQLDRAKSARDLIDGTPVDLGNIALYKGQAFQLLGNTQQARIQLLQAEKLMVDARYPLGIALSKQALAELALTSGNLSDGEKFARESIRVFSRIRGKLASIDLRANYGARQFGAYGTLIDIAMRRHQMNPDADHARNAFSLVSQAKGQTLAEVLYEPTGTSDAPDEIFERRDELLQKVSRHAGRNSGTSSEAELARILTELDTLDARILARNPRGATISGAGSVDILAIQSMLDIDELLLQFYVGPGNSYLFAVGKSEFFSIELPFDTDTENLVRSALSRLRNIQSLRDDTRALSELLLAPVYDLIARKSRLVVIADGALNYLPFEILLGPDQRPLVETHTLSYIPSASTLAFFKQQALEKDNAELQVAVFADPIFSANDSRLKTRTERKLASSTRSTDSAKSRELELNRLVQTGREAAAIKSEVAAGKLFLAMDGQATRANFLEAASGNFDIVHLATHGQINADRPELTGLTFSRYDADGMKIDSFVGLRDIYSLSLSAELVVLSACDTALGRDIPGEGLIGLTRGFLYAGAQRVVASLWQVQDRSTAELMRIFYERRLREGLGTAESLRAAKNQVRAESRWRHPYYWSGVVLQGL